MLNKLLSKRKDPNYVRSIVLLLLDSTNDFGFTNKYNKKQIMFFRKRLYANYGYILDHFYNLKKKNYINDLLVNDIFNYTINYLTNYAVFYDNYIKTYDNYFKDDNNAYDYFLNNDPNIIRLKKQLYRSIYQIAYFYKNIRSKKEKVNPV